MQCIRALVLPVLSKNNMVMLQITSKYLETIMVVLDWYNMQAIYDPNIHLSVKNFEGKIQPEM